MLPALPARRCDSIRRTKRGAEDEVAAAARRRPARRRANLNVQLRRELGLFATVRPLKNLPGLPARFQGVDMLVIREITEDLYASIEHEIVPGVVQSIKVVTKAASERFLRFAFDYAKTAGRQVDRLRPQGEHPQAGRRPVPRSVPRHRRGVSRSSRRGELIVDNCCMQMVSRPQQFDVLVMGNLYGDLVSDLAAGVVGGVSATHGINVGDDGLMVYECFHGGDRDAIPEGKANPLPLLLPAIDLLAANGHRRRRDGILDAVGQGADARQALTPDLGGKATTAEVTAALVAALD